MNKTIWIFLTVVLVISSCKENNPLKVNVEKIEVKKLIIKRYEQQLFRIPTDSFISKVISIQNAYPVFLEGNIKDTSSILGLKTFFTDPYMIELFDLSQNKFSDISNLESQIQLSFKYLKYHFPIIKIPTVYTYISGLDIVAPNKYIGSDLVIGLDMYLGDSIKAYATSGFPAYKVKFFKPEFIVRDCMSEIAVGLMPYVDKSGSLLDEMIFQGKRLYFIQAMIPDISDTVLLKYSSSQLKWINEYEPKVWSLMLENQYLFDKNPTLKNKFMNDGPFTTMFAKNSPARIGEYIGWKIVSAYMKQTNTNLRDLLREKDNQKIFKVSKYKPKI